MFLKWKLPETLTNCKRELRRTALFVLTTIAAVTLEELTRWTLHTIWFLLIAKR